jgi:50S ribosomal protein L16 3-hydroxylase
MLVDFVGTQMTLDHLGGMSARRFLRDYWQKQPLLIRQAFRGFRGLLDKQALLRMAASEDVESRLVRYSRGAWQLAHGPFSAGTLAKVPKRHWTLLVQDLNHHLAGGVDLLRHFSFVPHARVDDVMVSYAAPGGGVGPHVDSYDVFLLQGPGRRRWQISRQTDLTLVADVPLKILRDFRPEQEWVLQPGDMLYLPPGCAHDGVAMDECMTYSIGFRSPSVQELAHGFLGHLQDELAFDGMYADPDLSPSAHPGEIPAPMLEQTAAIASRIRWNREDIAHFLGAYMSEPKPHVIFAPPARTLSQPGFVKAASSLGVCLAAKTRMLYRGQVYYLNGERFKAPTEDRAWLRELADWRHAGAHKVGAQTAAQLYDWYCAGFVELQEYAKKPFSGQIGG